MIIFSLIGLVKINSIVLLFSSEITPIVNKGVKSNSNNGMSSKKLERLAIPEFKILGAGSGNIQINKPVIDKKLQLLSK